MNAFVVSQWRGFVSGFDKMFLFLVQFDDGTIYFWVNVLTAWFPSDANETSALHEKKKSLTSL